VKPNAEGLQQFTAQPLIPIVLGSELGGFILGIVQDNNKRIVSSLITPQVRVSINFQN